MFSKLTQKLTRKNLQTKIINEPYYRFQSGEEIAIAAELGISIDVNQASIDEWLRLPGISIHQARTLVELTGMGMQFLSLEDIAAAISVPVQRLQLIKPILNFCFYDPDSVLNPQKVNPNLASLEELEKIPIINNSLAQLILEKRKKEGNYRNLADLQGRLSLNSQLTSQLMHYLKFN
jgi:DNA uptake protein ComE-like DNA-binding protein